VNVKSFVNARNNLVKLYLQLHIRLTTVRFEVFRRELVLDAQQAIHDISFVLLLDRSFPVPVALHQVPTSLAQRPLEQGLLQEGIRQNILCHPLHCYQFYSVWITSCVVASPQSRNSSTPLHRFGNHGEAYSRQIPFQYIL
jgi:hypothetical protein